MFTRLKDEKDRGLDGRSIVKTSIRCVFDDYLDLYASFLEGEGVGGDVNNNDDDYDTGVIEYKNYRRETDPARPILKKLFGEEFTEAAINELYA